MLRALKNFELAAAAVMLVCATLAPPARAAETAVQLDVAQTQVNFTLADVLHTVHGTFRLKRASLRFDPATGKAGGELVVDAQSGDSGSHARDSRMHKNVLESDRFPEIVFVPDRLDGVVPSSGPFQVTLHGMFRIHGAQHELALPVTAQLLADGQLTADLRFVVPYVKWGMKNPSNFLLHVSENVDIDIHVVGRLSPAGQIDKTI